MVLLGAECCRRGNARVSFHVGCILIERESGSWLRGSVLESRTSEKRAFLNTQSTLTGLDLLVTVNDITRGYAALVNHVVPHMVGRCRCAVSRTKLTEATNVRRRCLSLGTDPGRGTRPSLVPGRIVGPASKVELVVNVVRVFSTSRSEEILS